MFDLYQIIIAIVIGSIAGIIEFLPISSTGHIFIIAHFLHVENNNIKMLEIFIQIGSTLSILYFFRKKISQIIRCNFVENQINILHIFCSLLPTIFFGAIFYTKIKKLFNLENIIFSLISGGLFLIFSEIFKPKKYNIDHIDDISILQSTIIGIFQIFALYPGFSRSGVTIGTAIILGIKKSVAIEFSFIISVPLLISASFFDLLHHITMMQILDLPIFFLGFLMSFLVSLILIKSLLTLLNSISLIFFGVYRFIISGLIYLFIN